MTFREKMQRFFYGRYGNDQLNNFLLAAYIVLCLFNIIVPTYAVSILMVIPLVAYFVRMFSRNVYKRQAENARFMKIWTPFRNWLMLQRDRIRDRKTHVYRKCPGCKSTLRLPRKPGVHQVACPKCRKKFGVRIK